MANGVRFVITFLLLQLVVSESGLIYHTRRKREDLAAEAYTQSCPSDEWLHYHGFCYYIDHNHNQTYHEAIRFCQNLGSAVTLVSIHGYNLNRFLSERINHDMWIGLSRNYVGGPFRWMDGTDVNFLNWAVFQPVHREHVFFGKISPLPGYWFGDANEGLYGTICHTQSAKSICGSYPCQNNGECTEDSRTYYCECKDGFTGTRCESATACPGRAWDELGDYCYYVFNNDLRTQEKADNHCKLLGGADATLASVHNDEVHHLTSREIYAEYWIGLWRTALDKPFKWIDGTSVDYTKWGEEYPSNNSGYDCVLVLGYGYWKNADCTLAKGYVCQTPKANVTLAQLGDRTSEATEIFNDVTSANVTLAQLGNRTSEATEIFNDVPGGYPTTDNNIEQHTGGTSISPIDSDSMGTVFIVGCVLAGVGIISIISAIIFVLHKRFRHRNDSCKDVQAQSNDLHQTTNSDDNSRASRTSYVEPTPIYQTLDDESNIASHVQQVENASLHHTTNSDNNSRASIATYVEPTSNYLTMLPHLTDDESNIEYHVPQVENATPHNDVSHPGDVRFQTDTQETENARHHNLTLAVPYARNPSSVPTDGKHYDNIKLTENNEIQQCDACSLLLNMHSASAHPRDEIRQLNETSHPLGTPPYQNGHVEVENVNNEYMDMKQRVEELPSPLNSERL